MLFSTPSSAFRQTSKKVELDSDFWSWSLPERYGWFVREVMVKYMPKEILPGDLLAGARFNIQTSMCQTKEEAKEFEKLVYGKGGSARAHPVVPQPWLRQHRRHQRPPHPGLCTRAARRLEVIFDEEVSQKYEALPRR